MTVMISMVVTKIKVVVEAVEVLKLSKIWEPPQNFRHNGGFYEVSLIVTARDLCSPYNNNNNNNNNNNSNNN